MSEVMECVSKDNLGKRQQTLNARVNAAAAKNVNFEEIRNEDEKSDIEKLFKVDLAAKYKHTEFIVEVLKSGDSFYIMRVIKKCSWLFDNINIVNPEYLHQNIFKFMSVKMKKKFLTAVSNHVRSKQRATDFYHYCMKNQLINNGLKFFLFTADDLKNTVLLNQDYPHFKELIKKDSIYMKHLIGSSFSLLEAYLTTLPTEKKYDFILKARHMYKINCVKYLDLLERHAKADDDEIFNFNLQQFWPKYDEKFSRKLMLKHKKRILANPWFFVKRLDNETFLKHITPDDAKILAVAFLPNDSCDFWDKFYYRRHKFFLKLIPDEEIFAFLKKIFHDRYPNAEFEMSPWFYTQDFHLFMTIEERELWALRHLKSEKQSQSPIGSDYNWYEFINFETSFNDIKQMMPSADAYEQNGMIKVLVRSARNNCELKMVFDYYNEVLNESRQLKDSFLHHVIYEKNILDFDESSWSAFYKLLISMELFNTELALQNNIYKTVTLLYHVLYQIEINEELNSFLLNHFSHRMINTGEFGHYNKLSSEKRNIIYDYLFRYYIDRMSQTKDQLFTIEVSSRLKRYFENINGLMRLFRAEDVKQELVKKDGKISKKVREINNSLSDRQLLRLLKKDTELVVADDIINKIIVRFDKYPIRINNFLKKVKIYFPEDVTQTYLAIFTDLVSKKNENVKSVEASVLAMFLLSDQNTILDLIEQYAPQELTSESLNIQKAICRFFCYARPSLPITGIKKLITRNSMKFYRHLSDMFLSNLPIPQCLEFLELINKRTDPCSSENLAKAISKMK